MDSPNLDLRMIRKAEGAIRLRTSRLIVVVERCTNDHNYSAILRTVEALGVQHVWIIDPPITSTVEGMDLVEEDDEEYVNGDGDGDGDGGGGRDLGGATLYRSTGQVVKRALPSEARDRALHHLFAKRATEWLTVREFGDTSSCLAALRDAGCEVWATDLSQEAVPLTVEDLANRRGASSSSESSASASAGGILPERLAIAFGTEAVGCTAELLASSDMRVYLPLRGFADSLNLSVATALVVHHLFLLDPTLAGAMGEDERSDLRRRWYAKLCRQRLLTSAEKRERGRLAATVAKCEELERRLGRGEALQAQQRRKLDELAECRARLEAMDRDLEEKSRRAVEDLVRSPPDPITDMRRADEHRVTYVGKKTKGKYRDSWDGMPATANPKTAKIDDAASTSRFFRSKLEESSFAQTGTTPDKG